jgi:hypothetical protein
MALACIFNLLRLMPAAAVPNGRARCGTGERDARGSAVDRASRMKVGAIGPAPLRPPCDARKTRPQRRPLDGPLTAPVRTPGNYAHDGPGDLSLPDLDHRAPSHEQPQIPRVNRRRRRSARAI